MTMEILMSGLQNQGLRIPSKHRENMRRFTMTGQSDSENRRDSNLDHVPFDRYADIWWLALCVGIQEGRRTSVNSDDWFQFIRAGEVLPSNPWRLFQLQLMAIGVTGNIDILSKPGELINMANEYAATGLPIILDELLGSGIPVWAMTEFIERRLGIADQPSNNVSV